MNPPNSCSVINKFSVRSNYTRTNFFYSVLSLGKFLNVTGQEIHITRVVEGRFSIKFTVLYRQLLSTWYCKLKHYFNSHNILERITIWWIDLMWYQLLIRTEIKYHQKMYSINVEEILHSHAHDISLLHKTITICATFYICIIFHMIMEVIAFSSLLSCLTFIILMLSETLLSFYYSFNVSCIVCTVFVTIYKFEYYDHF